MVNSNNVVEPISYIQKEIITNILRASPIESTNTKIDCLIEPPPHEIISALKELCTKEDLNMANLCIIPTVTSVETFNDRCVKVSFADGTFTRSVCSANDSFDIDAGITICIMKRMLSPTNGTKAYNKLIKNIHKGMEVQEKLKEKTIEAEETRKARIRRIEMKKKARMLKKKEEQIDIVKQGYLRALAVNPDVECEACKID